MRYTVRSTSLLVPILGQMNPVHTLPRSTLILSSLYVTFSYQKYARISSPTCTTCFTPLILDLINLLILYEQYKPRSSSMRDSPQPPLT